MKRNHNKLKYINCGYKDCISGYKDMIEYKMKDGEDYYEFLIRISYATDPDYISKVKQIENKLEI